YIPPIRSKQIVRPRLFDLIHTGLDRALILVSAPAGYGKTTLVSSWLKEEQVPSAWLSLDGGDNDPIRFLQYLIAALLPMAPGIEGELSGMLQGIQLDKFENVINLLVNELASFSYPFVLVLDDFHVIQSDAVLKILSYLLEHLPAPMHLAILTRVDPPLPLSRLRVRNQLLDIRADQLCFTSPEIDAFLNEAMGLSLSATDLSALQARTEGWIASLQLAALSMQGCQDIHGFVSAFTGSHHYVMDYLADEVLKQQPGQVSAFLLQTSILDRLCAPLCEAVVDETADGPLDGQAMLEGLEEMNLFTIPLDDERRWYRYHHLFVDVLRKRLETRFPRMLPDLHRRASKWYEQNGFISESIQQAIAAGDQDRAAQLIEENGCLLLISGEIATLLSWTDAIEFQSETRPWLAIQEAWALALTGELERVEPTLQAPEQMLAPLEPGVEVRTMRGTIAAARAFCANTRGNTRLAAEYAQQALELLPDCSSISQSIRSVATTILGDASWINGDLQEAIRAYTEAIRIGREAHNLHMVVIANSSLADIFLEQGQLSRAADIYNQTLQMAVRPDGQRSPLAERIYAGLARVAYERNQLSDADQYIRLCIDLCLKWGDTGMQAAAWAMLGRLEQARGDLEGAREAMRSAEQLAGEDSLSTLRSTRVMSDLVHLWLANGSLERLSHLVQKSGLSIEDDIPYPREQEYMILLRVLLACGDYRAAGVLAGRLLQQAETAGQMGLVIELLTLQALAFQGKKDTDRALAVLERALVLAQPEGYVRVFLDEGEPVTRLLCQVQSRQVGTSYATELVAKIGRISSMTQPSMQLLTEPLTARELEVLKLIEAGQSNQEIAGQLVISIPTVKRHISNIYGKLGVESRTQAIAIGKELKLFE
ncbi:MAG TPA: LuxR C-terminal-related transcriptional regulator, partial [Anaerolineaceae bacterium]|nr:LuxR C-terminal-related transcriptional regulator [Anaerolineaceae bacterium]